MTFERLLYRFFWVCKSRRLRGRERESRSLHDLWIETLTPLNIRVLCAWVRAWPPSWTYTRTRGAVQGVKSDWWGPMKAWSSALVPAAAAAAGHPRVPARFEASCTTHARILVHLWWNNGGGIKRGNEFLCGRILSRVELRRSGAPEGTSQKVF